MQFLFPAQTAWQLILPEWEVELFVDLVEKILGTIFLFPLGLIQIDQLKILQNPLQGFLITILFFLLILFFCRCGIHTFMYPYFLIGIPNLSPGMFIHSFSLNNCKIKTRIFTPYIRPCCNTGSNT